GYRHTIDRDRVGEVQDHLKRRTAAAFDPDVTSERKWNIESTGATMSLSRERALRHSTDSEGADAYPPSNGARCGNILVYIPECDVVSRVNPKRRVVAPALGPCLGAGAINN